VCTAANFQCLGVLTLFGNYQNCTATSDYASLTTKPWPHTYDQNATSTVCNKVSAVVTVASTKETYLPVLRGRILLKTGILSLTFAFSLSLSFSLSHSFFLCHSISLSLSLCFSQSPCIAYLLFAGTVGACSGIVTELYVPPGQLVSPLIAPMQKPYTIQTIIETSLAKSFASLPKWVSDECHFSIRKYLCSSNMLAPQVQLKLVTI
jgi:hypothetical protein